MATLTATERTRGSGDETLPSRCLDFGVELDGGEMGADRDRKIQTGKWFPIIAKPLSERLQV